MYLLNLTIKFKDNNENIYYSTKYLSDKTLVTRNIMNDLETGVIKNVTSTNGGYPYEITFELLTSDETTSGLRKLKILKNVIEYGKFNETENKFITSDVSYYKKELDKSLITETPIINIEDNTFSVRIPISSMYIDETYDIVLLASSVGKEDIINWLAPFEDENDERFFHGISYETTIKTIKFVDYIDTSKASIKCDVSEFENGGIIAWLEDDKTTLYIGSKTVIYSYNLAYYFNGMTAV